MGTSHKPWIWNTLVGAFVYITIYLVGKGLQLFLQFDENPINGIGYALIEFLNLFPGILVAVIIHTLVLQYFHFFHRRSRFYSRVNILLTALILIPSCLLFLAWVGGGKLIIYFLYFPGHLAGTIAYGLLAKIPLVPDQKEMYSNPA